MRNYTIILVLIIAIIVIGVIAWVNYYAPVPTTETQNYQNDTASSSLGVSQSGALTINTASDPVFGTYLVDSNGMALYTYSKDSSGVSRCTGDL